MGNTAYKWIFIALGMACLAGLVVTQPVFAFPSLPSSFYGHIHGPSTEDELIGAEISASINGQVVAQGQVQSYQGQAVYSLDIPGDDPDTAAVDGGTEGDQIQFQVNGVTAQPTGEWRMGVNQSLDLDLSPQPAASPTAIPTPRPVSAALQPVEATPAQTLSAAQPENLLLLGITAGLLALAGLAAVALPRIKR